MTTLGLVQRGVVGGLLFLLMGLMILMVPSTVFAEGFADLYLGAAVTSDADVDGELDGFDLGSIEDVGFDSSLVLGGRAGYWWQWFGLGLDLSYWAPDAETQTAAGIDPLLGVFTTALEMDQDVFMVGLPLMVRARLVPSDDLPDGRLHLHGYLAPALFVSSLDATLSVTSSTLGSASASADDTVATFGVGAGAGATFMFTRNIGVFGEYRFTHFSPEYDLEIEGSTLTVETDVTSHHFLVGVAFRF